jgi:hypothetical protein
MTQTMQKIEIQTATQHSLVKNSDNREATMTDTKTASDIYSQLGIAEPFKAWITKQPGFDMFESFYGTLPGGKLGKDYRLKPEQAALLLPTLPSLPKPIAAPVKKKKPPPEIIIDGQRSVYWYANSMGQHLDKQSLDLLGRAAGARCNELGIVIGVKFQKEIRPDGRKWQGRVRTYPPEILESIMNGENAQNLDSTELAEAKQ